MLVFTPLNEPKNLQKFRLRASYRLSCLPPQYFYPSFRSPVNRSHRRSIITVNYARSCLLYLWMTDIIRTHFIDGKCFWKFCNPSKEAVHFFLRQTDMVSCHIYMKLETPEKTCLSSSSTTTPMAESENSIHITHLGSSSRTTL